MRQIPELSFGPEALEVTILNGCDASRIIPAVFQAPQRVHQIVRDRLSTENTNNPAHQVDPRV
jgi:hypothetical protein